jgi:nicotinamide riboside kinase
MFSLYYHKKATRSLKQLAKKAEKRYDVVFLCGDEMPYHDTWDRSGDVKRKAFQKEIIRDLKKRRVKYTLLKGRLSERIAKARRVLALHNKYGGA